MDNARITVGRIWRTLAVIVWFALAIPLLFGSEKLGIDRDAFLFLCWAVPGSTALYAVTQVLTRLTVAVLPGKAPATA